MERGWCCICTYANCCYIVYLRAEQPEAKNSADHEGQNLAMSGGAALDNADHGSEHSATSGAMAHGWVAAARQASEPEAGTRRAVESVGCSWAGPVARERINWWPMLADVRSSVDGTCDVTAERSRFT